MLIEGSTLVVFVAAALALLITPGPAVLYIITRSIDQGRVAGVVSAFGVGSGTIVHVAAAAFGLSALFESSVLAFTLVKFLGAGYLIYLGIQKLLEKDKPAQIETPEPEKLSRIFYQGFIVNLLNPKLALFFLSFLPQFIHPENGSVVLQILLLGALFVVLGVCSDSSYALVAGSLRGWLRNNLTFARVQRYFAGGIYIALGLTAAFSGSGSDQQ